MMKLIILFLGLSFFSTGLAQVNWEQFKAEKKSYYATLEGSAVENFSCLVSSSEYIRFISSIADSSYYYPLKLIWMIDGKAYYILQPFPNAGSSIQQQLISKVEDLKGLLKGTIADWQQFSLSNPFADIPQDARISFGNDTVGVSFTLEEDAKTTRVKKLFTRGGQLAEVLWSSGDFAIATYPYYKEIEGKWVCRGWKSQFYKNGEVSSGLAVALELTKIENLWLPTRFDIIAQSSETPTQRSIVQLFLKSYIFNQEFEVVPAPSDTTKTSQK